MFDKKEYAKKYYKNKWENDSEYREKSMKRNRENLQEKRTDLIFRKQECLKTQIYQANHPQYCKDCGKRISCHPSMVKRCVSCSRVERFKDPRNHPNWQGGKSFEIYPLGWRNTFKEQIRQRDDYKCQLCGCPGVECKVKLHIHHIDYNKNNLNINNLISLCKSCHSKTNVNRNYWQRIFETNMCKQA